MSTCLACGAPIGVSGEVCQACTEKARPAAPVWRRPLDLPSDPAVDSLPAPFLPRRLADDGGTAAPSVTRSGTRDELTQGPAPGTGHGNTPPDRRWLVVGGVAVMVAVLLGFGLHGLLERAGDTSSTSTRTGSITSGEGFAPDVATPGSWSPTSSAQITSSADLPTGSTADASATGASPAEEASAVEALLDRGAAGRGLVGPAVLSLSGCSGSTDPRSAASSIEQAAQNRQELLVALEPLAVDALPGGVRLKALLRQAWTESLQADQLYLAWARTIAGGGGCDPQSPTKLAADEASVRASQAKASFVAGWNANVAAPLHLMPRQEKDL